MTQKPPLRILVVDDDLEVLEVVTETLAIRMRGTAITAAHSAEDALVKCASATFDVIVSDVSMPGKSGLEMLATLTARGVMTPVIFMSGYGDKAMVAEAWRLGAFDFLDKPLDPVRLVENVRIAIEVGESFNRHRLERKTGIVRVKLPPAVDAWAKEKARAAGLTIEEWCAQELQRLACA